MVRQMRLIGILIFVLIETGCATTTPYNPFKIPQDEIYNKTKIIALWSVSVPSELEDPEPVKAKFESLIEARLREAGFSVIPSRETQEVWEHLREQIGGFFDPITGKRDESKYKTVMDHWQRELNTKFNADAVLYPGIVFVKAVWWSRNATWDGTSESIKSFGESMLEGFGLSPNRGTVGALSLGITITDIHGNNMYINRGGVQILSKISGGNFVSVPRQDLFVNEERNTSAVNIALDPLVKKTMPTEASKEKL